MAMAMATGKIKFLHSTSSFLPPSNNRRSPSPLHLPPHVSSSRLSVYLADASPSAAAHPWAEWKGFLEKLRRKGFPDTASSAEAAATGCGDGGGLSDGPLDSSKYYCSVESACLRFAREHPDLLRSLSGEDIKVVVERGCPNLLLKSVHAAKRLRGYLKINEADVCSSCNLCNTCDRAYVIEKLHERANTVDLVHLLLQFAVAESSVKNTKEGPHITESAKKSIRKLLSQLIELSDTEWDPDLLTTLTELPKVNKAPHIPKAKEATQVQNVEMKREDWICTRCGYINYARHVYCLKCKADGPDNFDSPEVKNGDWICPQCQYMNFATRLTYRTCEEPHPKETLDPAGWECPPCDFMNDARNLRCLRCQVDGLKRVDFDNPEMKKEDWTCPRCQSMNIGKNLTCRACGEPQPKETLDPAGWKCPSCHFMNDARNLRCEADGPERVDSDRPDVKEGDWTCPRCQYMNVGINLTCWTCEEPHPKETLDPAGWECPSCLRCKADGPESVDSNSPELKKGDWTCLPCQYVNFGKDLRCWICEEPHPKETLDPADWECPLCKFMNDARNLRCLQCQVDGPKRVEFNSPEMKKGDWTCPRCQSMNIGKNLTCRTCEEPHPRETLDPAGWKCPSCDFMNDAQNLGCLRCKADGPKTVDFDSSEFKKGDWTCPRCQYTNIGKNLTCRICEEPRPNETLDPTGWECPSCALINDSRNLRCLRCKEDGPKRGVWTCPRCQYVNIGKNLKCLICKELAPKKHWIQQAGNAPCPKRGVWTCPGCQYVNFNKNQKCRVCKKHAPMKHWIQQAGNAPRATS